MSHRKYALRTPRFAAGIRLQDRGRVFNRSWWAKRWFEAIEMMNLRGRLARGRAYALSGQVTQVKIAAKTVEMQVLGVREDPYRVKLQFRAPTGEAREKIVAALKGNPMNVERLSVNDLPLEVEEIFRRHGYTLFPGGKLGEREYDVTTSCTCPDYANPCKHSIAALLILGDEVARCPARLLEFRGIRLEELYEN